MILSRKYSNFSQAAAFAAFLAAFTALPAAFAQNALAHCADNADAGRIKVEATGTATAKPDMALLQISVSHESKTAKEALAQTSAALGNVLAELKKQGIADKDMQTEAVNVSPVYHEGSEKGKKEKDFAATAQIAVKIRAADKAGQIMDAAIAKGATGLSDLVWTNSDLKPLYKQARENALANALEKIDTYAAKAYLKRGQILRIEEGSDNFTSPRLYARVNAAAMSAPVPLAEGEKDYNIQISVTAELLDKTAE